jgi:hypothetical protein
MINELLEKFDLLTDIAIELYGDEWVMNEKFWGSVTEKEMCETMTRLDNLGHKWPDPTQEQIERASEIARKLDLL